MQSWEAREWEEDLEKSILSLAYTAESFFEGLVHFCSFSSRSSLASAGFNIHHRVRTREL